MSTAYSTKVCGKFCLPLFLGLWLFATAFKPQRVLSAEKLKLVYGPLNCSLSISSLETYARTGEITDEFKFYAKFIDDETLIQLRHWLQKSFEIDQVAIYRYSKTSEGEKLLRELGTVVTTHSQRNGFYAIRAALVATASQSNDWTLIDVMYHFPTDNLQVNTKELFLFTKFWQESNTAFKPAVETN